MTETTWNYRVLTHETDEDGNEYHQVFVACYRNGRMVNRGTEPSCAGGATIEELRADLEKMLAACELPVLRKDDVDCAISGDGPSIAAPPRSHEGLKSYGT